ncbi:oxidoreductase [Weissella cibaria]
MTDYNFLQPLALRHGAKLRNRIVFAPTTLSASFFNGVASTDDVEYYRHRAGGVGLVIVGASYVDDLGRGFPGQLGISDDNQLAGLKRLVGAIHDGGAKAVVQLHHAGRMSYSDLLPGGQAPVAPSAIPNTPDSETPRALTDSEIREIIEDFGSATKRAIDAGFDGVEIHGANHYLLQQFFSPSSNKRTDSWGTDRTAFPLAVAHKVADAIRDNAEPGFILGYRISPEETNVDGYRINDTVEFAQQLTNEVPLDYLNLSQPVANQSPFVSPEIKTPVAKLYRDALPEDVAVLAVGNVRKGQDAEAALADTGADLVGLAVELIIEPKWIEKVAAGQEDALNQKLSELDYVDLHLPQATVDSLLKPMFGEVVPWAGSDNEVAEHGTML